MIEAKNKARFALEGFRVRRSNADGTMAMATRVIGFSGTVNLSKILDGASIVEVSVKVGAGNWQTEEVDFSAITDTTAVTVAQAVTALTQAGFTGVTFTKEPGTERLKAAAAGAAELQLKGKLFGAMDFGQGIKYGGLGSYWKSYINDEAISAALPNDIVEKEEIDMESAKGAVTRMIIPAKRLGASPALVMKFKDDELTQLVQGGEYTPATITEPATYLPPKSDLGGSPLITLDAFAPLYGDGASQMDQVIGMDRRLFFSCTGIEGDVPMEAKTWAQFAYNLTATEYTDEAGEKFPAEKRFEYNLSQWQAANFAGIGAE